MGHIFSSNINSQKMVPHMISIWIQSDRHIADKKCYVQVDIVYSILENFENLENGYFSCFVFFESYDILDMIGFYSNIYHLRKEFYAYAP